MVLFFIKALLKKHHEKKEELLPWFHKFINELKGGRRLQKNGFLVRPSTIDNYLILQKHLQRYSEQNALVLRVRDYDSLTTRERKTEKNYWKKFYLGFTDYLFNKIGAHDNYVGSTMKLLRSFFNYLNDDCGLNTGSYHNRFYITHEEIPILVLYPERLNFLIHDKEFEESLPKFLKVKKDMFVFGCTTALRFGDLSKLTPTNIETINDRTYLSVKSQKTGIFSRVYLPGYAVKILAKYKRRKKSLFPPISITNFNSGIKQIALRAGWTEELVKTRSKRGEAHTYYRDAAAKTNYRFCDLISSHAMRRTAITTMLQMGMNEINVRNISGHKANSPSFYRYVNYADSFMDEEIDKFHAAFAALGKPK